jgi:hypothetical protein
MGLVRVIQVHAGIGAGRVCFAGFGAVRGEKADTVYFLVRENLEAVSAQP